VEDLEDESCYHKALQALIRILVVNKSAEWMKMPFSDWEGSAKICMTHTCTVGNDGLGHSARTDNAGRHGHGKNRLIHGDAFKDESLYFFP
jgi:hypothetical protein